MLMPSTRMWTSRSLNITTQTTAQTAVRSSVTFKLRPNIARRSHEREPGLLTGVCMGLALESTGTSEAGYNCS
jgi:hypothetical protein